MCQLQPFLSWDLDKITMSWLDYYNALCGATLQDDLEITACPEYCQMYADWGWGWGGQNTTVWLLLWRSYTVFQ